MHLAFSSMNTPNDPHPAELARALEERGFESLWYGEHSHIPCSRRTPYPPGGEMPDPYRLMMDPYLSLMTAANATTTLRLGTGIALLMERDLFSQAKTIATLDRLSGGRVMIGPGWGILTSLGSYNKFRNRCQRDALVVPLLNCFTSILAGFVVFSVLGFMAHRTGTTVEKVTAAGE